MGSLLLLQENMKQKGKRRRSLPARSLKNVKRPRCYRHISSEGRGGGAYSFVSCLSHLTIDHSSSLSRRSTVPSPDRDISNISALSAFLPYTTGRHGGRNCFFRRKRLRTQEPTLTVTICMSVRSIPVLKPPLAMKERGGRRH